MEYMHKITTKKINIHPISSGKLSRGMVLITTLLILLVVSLLATSLLKTSLITKKINLLNQNKVRAFDLAINKLQTLESEVGIYTNKNVKTINSGIHGIDFYKIRVVAEYDGITSEIQSIWARLNHHYLTCDTKIEIRPGRQSFLIIK